MPSTEAVAQVCFQNICLDELTSYALTAVATVGALLVSLAVGLISILFTWRDRRERRSFDEERRSRVFGYGDLEPDGLRLHLINGTDFPVRNISLWALGYMSSPEPTMLHKGFQTGIPMLEPGQRMTLWLGFDRYDHLADMKGKVGLRIDFIDINGQAWVRRPDGKVLKQEKLAKGSGFELPTDAYSYAGPHTNR